MADKFIEIKRFYGLIEEAQSDPDTVTWLGESWKPMGPYWANKATATGLSFEEQKLLLPNFLGIEASDKDFRKRVETFYDEFLTPVPAKGLKINIGLREDNDKPVSESNWPIVLKDYLIYRHTIGNPEVASSEIEAKRNPTKKFYMVDPEKISGEAIDISKLEDEALQLYFNNKDNEVKVNMILTMMNVRGVYNMNPEEKKIKLKSFATRQPNLNEYQQKIAYTNFKNTCKDKDLETKFLITELIGAQVLEKVGTAILLKETGEKLGDTMAEAVLFVNNNKNTRFKNKLYAEYNIKVREGVFKTEEVKTEVQPSKAD